jgi:hypothetical protein
MSRLDYFIHIVIHKEAKYKIHIFVSNTAANNRTKTDNDPTMKVQATKS